MAKGNDRPISINARPTTEEGRKWIEDFNQRETNQSNGDAYANYGTAQEAIAAEQRVLQPLQQPVQQPTAQQPQQQYWQDPSRLVTQYTYDRANPATPDEARDVPRDQVKAAFDHYAIKNNGAPVSEWKLLDDSDPYYSQVLSKWKTPATQSADTGTDPATGLPMPQYNPGRVEDLGPMGKVAYHLVPASSTAEDSTGIEKYTRQIIPTIGAAGGGAAVGTLVAGAAALAGASAAVPVGAAMLVGGGLVGGLTLVQNLTGVKIPVINKFLSALDWSAQKVESLWYTGESYIENNEVAHAGKFVTELARMMIGADTLLGGGGQRVSAEQAQEEFDARMAASTAGYETHSGAVDWLMGGINKLTSQPTANEGEVYRYDLALNEPQSVPFSGPEAIRAMTESVKALMKETNPETGKNYTPGEAADIVQAYAAEVFGTSGQFSDLVWSEIADPVNLIPFALGKGIEGYGKATGDAALVKAAQLNTGSPLIDILPLGLQNIAAAVSRRFGGPGGSSGAITILDTYKGFLQNGVQISDMTPQMKVAGGLTSDGKIRELQPISQDGKLSALKALFELKLESKVEGVGALAMDAVNAMLSESDPATMRAAIEALASDVRPDPNSPAAGIWGTAAHATVLEALQAAVTDGSYQVYFDVWDLTEGNRRVLTDLSDTLQMKPRDLLTLLQDKPDVWKTLVSDAAAKSDGRIAGQIVDDGGVNLSRQLEVFTGKDAQAWNPEMLQYEVSVSLADAMSAHLVNQYGITKDATIVRLSNLMKTAQSGLLLGWSPSYIANNMVNNIVTRAERGAVSGMSIRQIDAFLSKNGMSPARYGEGGSPIQVGASSSGSGPMGRFHDAVGDAKRTGDLIDKTSDAIKTVNKVSLGTLGGKVEVSEGKRAFGAGVMQYVNQIWKRDKGFRRMDDGLRSDINAQVPGFAEFIESTIGKNFNMDDIERSLFRSVMTPSTGEILAAVAKKRFGEEPIVAELFGKNGLSERLKERMDKATTRAERRAVIDEFLREHERYIDAAMANEIVHTSESIGNVVASEGLPAVYQLMNDAAVMFAEHWIRSREDFSATYDTKLRNRLTAESWRAVIQATIAREEAYWKHYNALTLQMQQGIVRGLRFDDPTAKEYVRFVMDEQSSWRKFNTDKSDLINETYRKDQAIQRNKRLSSAQKEAQSKALWDKFYGDTNAAYDTHFMAEQEFAKQRDTIFVQAYESITGAKGDKLADMFAEVRSIRQEMYLLQKKQHEQTRNIRQGAGTAHQKDVLIGDLYKEFNPQYTERIQRMRDLAKDVATESQKDGFMARAENGRADIQPPAETTPEGEIKTAVELSRMNKAADQTRKQAAEKQAGYLHREEIRQKWIDSGMPEDVVDFQMALQDALAERWQQKHPGRDYYNEALKIKEISRAIDADGLSQGATKADIRTPEFRKFFDGSKVVNEDGSPKVVYHGSPNEFDTFDYSRMGTSGTTEGYGFYFSDSPDIAKGYARGTDNYYESYVDIKKPISSDSKSIKRSDVQKLLKSIDKMDMASAEPGHWLLSDFGDIETEGLPSVLRYASDLLFNNNDNDLDIVSEIINTSGDAERVYRALKSTLGYDGVIAKWGANESRGEVTVYVPFLPEQIKSVYNQGTFDTGTGNMFFQTAPAIESDNFKKWFRNSQVVDDDGQPLVVYHGSAVPFDTFDPEFLGENTGAASAREGYFFTKDRLVGESYAGTATRPDGWQPPELIELKAQAEDLKRKALQSKSEEDRGASSKANSRYEAAKAAYTFQSNTPIENIEISINRARDDVKYFEYELRINDNERNRAALEMSKAELDDLETRLEFTKLAQKHAQNYSKGVVTEAYLEIQNPFVYDFEGSRYREQTYYSLIQQAKENGNDGVILKNTFDPGSSKGNVMTDIYVIFDPGQAKRIDNEGSWSRWTNNMLLQQAKGAFEVMDNDTVIRMFKSADVSTMVHESGHAFRRTLDYSQMADFTRWAGFESVEQYRTLENRYWQDPKALGDAERQRYIDAEEKFARGWEQYLTEGKAPTARLQRVFEAFTEFLLDIYTAVKKTLTGTDYGEQADFMFDGQPLNINVEINGVKLRDIFDSMLADTESRATYGSMLGDTINSLQRKYAGYDGIDADALATRARLKVNADILDGFKSLGDAETYVDSFPFQMGIEGETRTASIILDAIDSARRDAAVDPFRQADFKEVRGSMTAANGIANPNNRYEFQFKVVELGDLQASHQWVGDTLQENATYLSEQPRLRGQVQSVMQTDAIARGLVPEELLFDSRSLDKGAPIVDRLNNVESGNGRTIALNRAREMYPDRWAEYQSELRAVLPQYDIDPSILDSFENPVLVRERQTSTDVQRFVSDANKPNSLQMTAQENALTDATLITPAMLTDLEILDTETIEGALDSRRNAPFVSSFISKLSQNEAGAYSVEGRHGTPILNEAGRQRIVNALFAKVYGQSDNALLKSFTTSTDSNIRFLESALKDSLPQMALIEGMFREGARDPNLSIASDVAQAAQQLIALRQDRQSVSDYLNQVPLPGVIPEIPPIQRQLLDLFDEARSAKPIRNFLREYARLIQGQADPRNIPLFDLKPITREYLVAKALSPEAAVQDALPLLQTESAPPSQQQKQMRFDSGDVIRYEDLRGIVATAYDPAVLQADIDRLYSVLSDGLDEEGKLYARGYLDNLFYPSRYKAQTGAPKDIQYEVANRYNNAYAEFSFIRHQADTLRMLEKPSIPQKGLYVQRAIARKLGDSDVIANVYYDGQMVAAYTYGFYDQPVRLSDGNVIQPIGLHPINSDKIIYLDPELGVQEIDTKLTTRAYQQGEAETILNRGTPLDTTPVIEPAGSAATEIYEKYYKPLINDYYEGYEARLAVQPGIKNAAGLNKDTQAKIYQYLDETVQPDLVSAKYNAMKFGEFKRDAALLNYNKQYGFDTYLTMIAPYQYWYTRSVVNWAKRMVEKPQWLMTAMRLKQMQDRNEEEEYPTRLDGKFRVPMAGLPDWWGGGVFYDPMSQLFPFLQFLKPLETHASETNTLNKKTMTILEEMENNSEISFDQRVAAVRDKSGPHWDRAMAQAKAETGKDPSFSNLFEQFFGLPLAASWIKNIYQDTPDQIGLLPITRFGNTIKTLTSDTILQTPGAVAGDILTLPEKGMRKVAGLDYNEFGQYGAYNLRKQISQMAADGDVDVMEALNAMIELSGPVYDEAVRRQREENMIKTQGALPLYLMKQFLNGEAPLSSVLGSTLFSPFGAALFPAGEKDLRYMAQEKQRAYQAKAGGDTDALNRFYDMYPEIVTREASFKDDPEELLRYVLYNRITNDYYDLSQANRQAVLNALGPDFERAIVNKETRNWQTVGLAKLGAWTQALTGNIPKVPELESVSKDPLKNQIQYYDNPVVAEVQTYYSERERLYPGQAAKADTHWKLPRELRKSNLVANPGLQEYIDWNSAYKQAHPLLQVWMDDRSFYYSEKTAADSFAEMPDFVISGFDHWAAIGKMRPAVRTYLEGLWKKHANPSFTTFEEYLDLLKIY